MISDISVDGVRDICEARLDVVSFFSSHELNTHDSHTLPGEVGYGRNIVDSNHSDCPTEKFTMCLGEEKINRNYICTSNVSHFNDMLCLCSDDYPTLYWSLLERNAYWTFHSSFDLGDYDFVALDHTPTIPALFCSDHLPDISETWDWNDIDLHSICAGRVEPLRHARRRCSFNRCDEYEKKLVIDLAANENWWDCRPIVIKYGARVDGSFSDVVRVKRATIPIEHFNASPISDSTDIPLVVPCCDTESSALPSCEKDPHNSCPDDIQCDGRDGARNDDPDWLFDVDGLPIDAYGIPDDNSVMSDDTRNALLNGYKYLAPLVRLLYELYHSDNNSKRVWSLFWYFEDIIRHNIGSNGDWSAHVRNAMVYIAADLIDAIRSLKFSGPIRKDDVIPLSYNSMLSSFANVAIGSAPALTYLMCIGASLSHCIMSGTFPNIVDISKEAYRASRSNVVTGLKDTWDMIDSSIDIAIRFVKSFVTGRCDDSVSGKDLQRLLELSETIIEKNTASPFTSANDHVLAAEYGDLLDECENLYKTCIASRKIVKRSIDGGERLWERVAKLRPAIVSIWGKFNSVMRQSALRRVPYSMSLYGGTSLGKSYLTKCVLNYLTFLGDYPADSRFHYYYSPGHKYMDGYAPWKVACILDDAGAVRSKFLSDGDPMVIELLQMINSTSYLTPQAELELKPICYFNSPLLLVTTNYRDLHANEYFHSAAVVLRRLRHHVTVKVADAFSARSGGVATGVLDESLAKNWTNNNPGQFPPFWTFTVSKFIPRNEVRGSDIVITGDFSVVVYNFQGNNVSMHEVTEDVFLSWMKDDYNEHVSNQVTAACDPVIDYCSQCQMPARHCRCASPVVVAHCGHTCEQIVSHSSVFLFRYFWWVFIVHFHQFMAMFTTLPIVFKLVRLWFGVDVGQILKRHWKSTMHWCAFNICRYAMSFIDPDEARRFDALFVAKVDELTDLAAKTFASNAQAAFRAEVHDMAASPVVGEELTHHARTIAGKFASSFKNHLVADVYAKFGSVKTNMESVCVKVKPYLVQIGIATTTVVLGLSFIKLTLKGMRSVVQSCASDSEVVSSTWNRGFVPQPYTDARAYFPREGTTFRGPENGPRFLRHVSKFSARLVIRTVENGIESVKQGQAMLMSEGIIVFNAHTIQGLFNGYDSVSASLFVDEYLDCGNPTDSYQKITTPVAADHFSLSKTFIYIVPNTDIALAYVQHQESGLDKYLMTARVVPVGGYFLTRKRDGSFTTNDIVLGSTLGQQRTIRLTTGANVDMCGFTCLTHQPIDLGDSGSIVVAHSGDRLNAVYGNVGITGFVVGKQGDRVVVQQFTKDMYEAWKVELRKQYVKNLSNIGVTDEVVTALCHLSRVEFDSDSCFGVDFHKDISPHVHPKSALAYPYTKRRIDGNCAYAPAARIYGSFEKYRSPSKTAYRKTPWADELRAIITPRGSFDHDFLPTTTKEPWVPHRICMHAMLSWHGEGVPRMLALQAANMFHSEVAFAVNGKVNPYKWLRPYTLHESINGIPGIIPSLDFATGGGYGYEGPKHQFFDTTLTPNATIRKCKPGLQDDVDKMIALVENGQCPHPVFTAHLKDEVRSKAKVEAGEIRVINGSPLPFTIVCRMYLLGIVIFMMQHKLETECCVGMNAESAEWSKLWEYLEEMDGGYMDADQPNFDKNIKLEISEACNVVLMSYIVTATRLNSAVADLWTPAKLRGAAVCLRTLSGMSLDFFGVLMRISGIVSSGNSLTVQKNCTGSSLYPRCAYILGQLSRGVQHIPTYRTYVRQANYGDDVVMKTSKTLPWFNHQHLCNVYKQWDIGYTLANKKQIGPDTLYTPREELQFVKRCFEYDEELGGMRAPLDFKSIAKSLLYYSHSPSLPLPEVHFANLLNNVSQNCLGFGRKDYEAILPIFVRLRDKYIHNTHLHREFVTYDSYVERWKCNSGLLVVSPSEPVIDDEIVVACSDDEWDLQSLADIFREFDWGSLIPYVTCIRAHSLDLGTNFKGIPVIHLKRQLKGGTAKHFVDSGISFVIAVMDVRDSVSNFGRCYNLPGRTSSATVVSSEYNIFPRSAVVDGVRATRVDISESVHLWYMRYGVARHHRSIVDLLPR